MSDTFEINGQTFTRHPLFTEAETRVIQLAEDEMLGYLKPSDEWTNGVGVPLPVELQDAARSLLERGWLPEFEEVAR